MSASGGPGRALDEGDALPTPVTQQRDGLTHAALVVARDQIEVLAHRLLADEDGGYVCVALRDARGVHRDDRLGAQLQDGLPGPLHVA